MISFRMSRATIQNQVVNGTSKIEGSQFSKSRMGFLTEKQFRVLSLRSRGFTQVETAAELKISRSSVSMLEVRARRQVERARQTLKLFELTQKQHRVAIGIGVRLQQIPLVVLQEADRYQIHLRSNMIDILRLVKKQKSDSLSADGRTSRRMIFSFNEKGKLTIL